MNIKLPTLLQNSEFICREFTSPPSCLFSFVFLLLLLFSFFFILPGVKQLQDFTNHPCTIQVRFRSKATNKASGYKSNAEVLYVGRKKTVSTSAHSIGREIKYLRISGITSKFFHFPLIAFFFFLALDVCPGVCSLYTIRFVLQGFNVLNNNVMGVLMLCGLYKEWK